MKPQSAKAKGRRLQQMVASDLLQLFPTLTEDDVRSTSMGAGGEDIQLSPAARLLIPFSIEAKNQERLNIWCALDQARNNAPSGSTPAVVFKRNNEKPQVALPWDTFLKMLSSCLGNQENQETKTRQTQTQLLQMATELQRLAANIT